MTGEKGTIPTPEWWTLVDWSPKNQVRCTFPAQMGRAKSRGMTIRFSSYTKTLVKSPIKIHFCICETCYEYGLLKLARSFPDNDFNLLFQQEL